MANLDEVVEITISTNIIGKPTTRTVTVSKHDFINCHSKVRFVENVLNLTLEPVLMDLLRRSHNLPELD